MLLLVSWNFTPENRDKVYQRFKEVGMKEFPGITAVGRWHTVGRNGGLAVVHAENEEAIGGLALAWNDVISLTIEPILDDEEYARATGADGGGG